MQSQIVARPVEVSAGPHLQACVPLAMLDGDPTLAVWTLGKDLTVTSASETATRTILGRMPQDVIDKHISTLVPPPVVERVASIVRTVLEIDGVVSSRVFWGERRLRSLYCRNHCENTPGDVVVLTRPEPVGFSQGDEETREGLDAPYAYVRDLGHLSPRELEVLALIGEGHSRAQIATGMYRSPKTIDAHQTSLRTKLKARGRVALATLARERGITRHIAALPRVSPLE